MPDMVHNVATIPDISCVVRISSKERQQLGTRKAWVSDYQYDERNSNIQPSVARGTMCRREDRPSPGTW